MHGECDIFVAALVVLVLGDGVRGIRPPAVFVLKMPWWLLRGVDTDGVAIVSAVEDRIGNLMLRSLSCKSRRSTKTSRG